MLDIKELKRLHDKAYNHNTVTRERAADDLVFYWITNWDDNILGESTLSYRGEFNVIRKAGRHIMADLRANPVQVDFQPIDEMEDDCAELIDGMYRSSTRQNDSIESFDTAKQESLVCGVGGWELFTEYVSNRSGDCKQVINRRPINEFNNNCLCDPNATLRDKSDSDYWSILVPYSKDGYKALVEELTGEEPDFVNAESFKFPEESYTFPWAGGQNDVIYVVRFYHREKVKDKLISFVSPMGEKVNLRRSDLDDEEDDLIEAGYSVESEKEIERYEVTLYIASGKEILKTYKVAGEQLPVIPSYGERAYIEGQEHYEGITRLAKDPQRLRNFQMSYLADIVSRSPRPKPMYLAEQIQGFESMYEENGADNAYPYMLQNRTDANGAELPLGPVGETPEQRVPQALMAGLTLTKDAIEDVSPAGMPHNIADIDLSGTAVTKLQNMMEQQSQVFQHGYKHALRRDGEVFASMASAIYDSPREVATMSADGTRSIARIMDVVMDEDSGEMIVINDLTNSEFEVYADIGADYTTKREETFERLGELQAETMATDPAMAKMISLKRLTMIGGVQLKDVVDYANKQLLLSGFKEPETDEEKEIMAQAQQQQQQPDPNAMLAQAEQGKAEAAMADVQRKAQLDQFNAQTAMQKAQVAEFEAQTKRLAVQIDAAEADATIDYKRSDMLTKRRESAGRFRASVSA